MVQSNENFKNCFASILFQSSDPCRAYLFAGIFPGAVRSTGLFLGNFVQGIFPRRPQSVLPEPGNISGYLCAVFPLMVRGNFTGFPIFCELLRVRLPQSGDF